MEIGNQSSEHQELRYSISCLSLIHIYANTEVTMSVSNGQKADIILADGTKVYKNRKPQDNKHFYEYSFDGGLVLNVDVYKRQGWNR